MTKAEKETKKAAKVKDVAAKKTGLEAKKSEKVDKKSTKTATTDRPKTVDNLLKESIKDDPQLEIKVAWEDVKSVYERVLRQVARTLKVDGFRPGKVPLSIAEDRVRQDYLVGEVAKQLMPGRLQKALEESKQKPDAEPSVAVTQAGKGKEWVFMVALPQRTEVKLPAYKKFLQEHKKKARELIEKSQKEAAKQAEKNKQKAPAALDEAQVKARVTDEALVALMQELKPQVSRTLVQRGAQQEYERLVDQLGKYQITWDDYLKNSGMSEEMLDQQLMVRALENIQMEFVLDALMAAEKVTVNDDELKAKMKEVMPDVVSEEDKKRQLAEPSVRDYLELITKRQKLAEWLLEL